MDTSRKWFLAATVQFVFLAILASSAAADDKAFTLDGKTVPEVVASVNGIEVKVNVLEREMMAYKMVSARQGKKVSADSEMGIARKILNKEIEKELIYQKARKMDVQVPSEIVLKELKKIEDQFPSVPFFERALAMQKLTRGMLREKIEKQLVSEKYLRKAIFPKVDVKESRAKEFYDKNADSFIKPEMYHVRHIFVAKLADSEGKTDDKDAAAKAKRIVDGINAEAKKKIERAAKKVKAGGDFVKLVKQFSEDEATVEKGGDLGVLLPETTIPAVAKAMTKLKKGETSGVITSQFGYHIIQLTDKIPSQKATYDEVKADILNILSKKEAEKLRDALLVELKKTAEIQIFI